MTPSDDFEPISIDVSHVFKEQFENEVKAWMTSIRGNERGRRAKTEAIRRLTESGELNFENEVELEMMAMRESEHLAAVQAEARRRLEAQGSDPST